MAGDGGLIEIVGGQEFDPSQTLTLTNSSTGLIVENDAAVYGTLTIGASSVKINNDGIIFPNGSTQTSAGGAGGSGAGLEVIELKSQLEKIGVAYPISNPNILNESFTDSANEVVTLRTAYTSGGSTIIVNVDKTDLDLMDATTGWTQNTGTPTIAQDTVNFIEGTASVKMSKTALNGDADMYKDFTAFSMNNTLLTVSARPDTLTNVDYLYIGIGSSASDSVWYKIEDTDLTAAQWNHLTIKYASDTPFSTAGTYVPSATTRIWFGIHTSSSQDVNVSWDFVTWSPDYTLPLEIPQRRYIWDGTNQEEIIISAAAGTGLAQRNTYTISPLTYSYAISDTFSKRRNITIDTYTRRGEFMAGLTGDASKTAYDKTGKWLQESVTSGTLDLSQRWWDESFKLTDVPSTTQIKAYSVTDKSGYFKNGDKILLYDYKKIGGKYNSRYNSTIGSNAKIVNLTSDTTYASGSYELTFNHDGTNAGVDSSTWYVARYSAELGYAYGAQADNPAITFENPTTIVPIGDYIEFPPSLSAYWNFDNEVEDIRYGRNLTQYGTPTKIAGKFINAYTGFSSSNRFCAFDTAFDLNTDEHITVEMWLKFATWTGTYQVPFEWSRNDANALSNQPFFIMYATNRFWWSYHITNAAAEFDPTPYRDGEWHYIVGTFSGGSGGYFRHYCDGVQQASYYASSTGYFHTASMYPAIGADTYSSGTVGRYPWLGDISEVAVHVGYVMPIEEIQARYANGLGKRYGFGTGFISRLQKSGIDAEKLFTSTKLTRQDPTNQNPKVFQRDAIIT